ncbi:MAG: prepilin-type N-terminal cleavage/methylation domain-containing protein [Gammaproteobacteria bacterium]|nr:prepilin-type N-terminal cleavage/methylation domain-containing protein [Gammaproteobacteria bacterium]
MQKLKTGFSIMEIMIAITIVAILIAIAFPSYQEYIHKSHRIEGIHTLLAIQLAEEKYRVNNASYGSLTDVWGGVTSSENGYYNLSISNLSATSYTLTATATGDQAQDSEGATSCASLVISYSNGITSKTPAACWFNY